MAVDRPSAAADAPCHAASFPEWSLIRDGTCRPLAEGGREEAMGGWEKGGEGGGVGLKAHEAVSPASHRQLCQTFRIGSV